MKSLRRVHGGFVGDGRLGFLLRVAVSLSAHRMRPIVCNVPGIATSDDGVATPFDSGGLLKCFVLPGPETPQQFLARHELPIPEHRRYLRLSMDTLFSHPRDYVEGTEPCRPGPIGLSGGDCRRWTHEVRIPDRIFFRGGHLQAAFAPRFEWQSTRRSRPFSSGVPWRELTT